MKKILFSTVAFLSPVLAFAQINAGNSITGQISDADDVVSRILSFFNVAIYILISLAVLFIIWKIVMHFIKGEGTEKQENLKEIGWGVLGLFIILSIWGLVNILVRTFSLDRNVPNQNQIPQAIEPR